MTRDEAVALARMAPDEACNWIIMRAYDTQVSEAYLWHCALSVAAAEPAGCGCDSPIGACDEYTDNEGDGCLRCGHDFACHSPSPEPTP